MLTSLSNRPTILLTMGDSRGIGPELIVRSVLLKSIRKLANLLVIGDLACIKNAKKMLKATIPLNEIRLNELGNSRKTSFNNNAVNILDVGSKNDGRDPLRYIDRAVILIKMGKAQGLVTAPVNKERITKSGRVFYGHTEYLAELTKAKRIAMMFTGGKIKVTVVTRHVPLKKAGSLLTRQKIVDAAFLTYDFLKDKCKIKKPKIGVCALNPHAGEGGMLGDEEKDKISPAVKKLKQKISYVFGPLPADSAFNLLYNKKLDGLIAMYHDQAMIPVKMLGRESCVNITLGLPFIRTSPVHGTAYDIAGKAKANPSGMVEAIRVASRLISV